MIEPRKTISRAFIAAVLLSASIVVRDWRNLNSWSSAAGIIAAAVSGGVKKNNEKFH